MVTHLSVQYQPVRAPTTEEAANHEAKHVGTACERHLDTSLKTVFSKLQLTLFIKLWLSQTNPNLVTVVSSNTKSPQSYAPSHFKISSLDLQKAYNSFIRDSYCWQVWFESETGSAL